MKPQKLFPSLNIDIIHSVQCIFLIFIIIKLVETLVCFIRNQKQQTLASQTTYHQGHQTKFQDQPEYKTEAKNKFSEGIMIAGQMEQRIFEKGTYEVETQNRKKVEEKKSKERKSEMKSVACNLMKNNKTAMHVQSLIMAKQNSLASSNLGMAADGPNLNCKEILSF